ncbi:hypothetical protein GCK72_006065 [Caenorhabditis remanei]|uniref:Uncharacterized protein n=1 Tax=Caenorhabditis remanei TaxID=31234 RepID=A0A6A5HFT9_CAERE|nr:hypothetical protein GCK72_006065 [Caenorhabditis remanei]KAF1766109.1 hypothetical protein GCK72_006065 [Caenorhabditis remanei]
MIAVRTFFILALVFVMLSSTEAATGCVHKVLKSMRVICENVDNHSLLKKAHQCCKSSCSMDDMWALCHE